jgi:hypothetical protein
MIFSTLRFPPVCVAIRIYVTQIRVTISRFYRRDEVVFQDEWERRLNELLA